MVIFQHFIMSYKILLVQINTTGKMFACLHSRHVPRLRHWLGAEDKGVQRPKLASEQPS
jgi:hypothetical protein